MDEPAPKPRYKGNRKKPPGERPIQEIPPTPKELRFIQEYPIDLNATQAAIRAGFSAAGANVMGCRLLKQPRVLELLEPILAERAMRSQVKADQVLVELGRLAFANIQDIAPVLADGDVSTITREQAACIQELVVDTYTEGRGGDAREVRRVRVKMAAKTPALESLGKHLGMYIERHAHAFGALGALSDEQIAVATAELAAQFGLAPTPAGTEAETRH